MTEIIIKGNTGNGNTVIETENIEGRLDALIIESFENLDIIIKSTLGYEIFHTASHIGTKYYAPRAIQMGSVRRLIVNDQFDKFNLNEPLEIIVNGARDTDFTIILRVL